MARSREKIGGRKEAAILALLTARSVEDAARAANVPPRTLYRWMQDPNFDAAFRRTKRMTFGQSLARFQQAAGAAAGIMLKIMVDNTVPATTRLKAAVSVFSHARDAIETEEIEARLAALERASGFSKQSDEND